ncbi:hypothetical protein K1804_002926 [Listeria monocytogenes]|uniref:hypothetical protein n=1 Tax=Listeria seeligeri TaxID=1640 RepID=UPI0016256BE1|nr:hypothetical protein [Listeria seeligeri]EFM0818568.1 hypothetical protein [Listeria monocytogenes]EFM2966953.1 hypothetical protein [Listeria monocytogenes]EHX3821622.1 hypothetical protein [Listeria monocytogenes]EHX3879534.1 hypothetical protein [Listeria monocytogenes]MBC1597639.1 hypothetical protein [Listeria seeligeri]
MKKFLLVFALSFVMFLCFTGVTAHAYSMKKGDIYVTNATSSKGLTGHAGIAISSTKILHIPGGGATTKLYTLSQWKSAYTGSKGDTWVYRPSSTSIASKAGNWAYSHYWNKNMGSSQTIKPKYGLGGSRFATNPTYCSKIVYQAYYYGSGDIAYVYPISGPLSPYDLRGGVFQNKYKPSKVATFK